MTLFKHEIKMNLKSLLIWSSCVGIFCFGCLLLFESLEGSIEPMADMYSQMGAFSTALGLDRLNISTIEGYYATEIALIFSIGGAMFSAMTGACMVSKEEEGHTSEFLNTLPFVRKQIIIAKYFASVAIITLFQFLCIFWELLGFFIANAMPETDCYVLYHLAQFFMQWEIGSLCFLLSSVCKRKQIGAALGFALLLYAMDFMCRVVPDIENIKYITPYYFSNASDIFTTKALDESMVIICFTCIILSSVSSFLVYIKRDLAA